LQRLDDLTDREREIITGRTPQIISNFAQTQLSFTWEVPDDLRIDDETFIEVLSTMAPCFPITVFRTQRVKFM
jgi:hypothetical protein